MIVSLHNTNHPLIQLQTREVLTAGVSPEHQKERVAEVIEMSVARDLHRDRPEYVSSVLGLQ
jgi:hypothetical protein